MSKPKNRRSVTFTRGRQRLAPQPEPEDSQETTNEIPRGSKQEIRFLIEQEEATSTTKIADRLNEQGYPCATAEKWTAPLVDSALRRKDMEDLRDRLHKNRGEPEAAGFSPLDVEQAAYDGAKKAVSELKLSELKLPEMGPVQIDTFHLKGAVSDATAQVFKGFRQQMDEANAQCASNVTRSVQGAMGQILQEADLASTVREVLQDADLASVKRVTNRTGENVGKVLTRIEDTCTELHGVVTGTLRDHSKAVIDACEHMALQVSEDTEARVDARFDALEDALVQKFAVGDLDAILARVVDVRLKAHLDEAMNRFAAMVEKLRSELTGKKVRKGR